MSDQLSEIKAKCEQYLGYQGESVGMSEVHAVLSFIHGRTIEAITEVERLTELNDASQLAYHMLLGCRSNLLTEIKNLRALCSSTGTGRPFFPSGSE